LFSPLGFSAAFGLAGFGAGLSAAVGLAAGFFSAERPAWRRPPVWRSHADRSRLAALRRLQPWALRHRALRIRDFLPRFGGVCFSASAATAAISAVPVLVGPV